MLLGLLDRRCDPPGTTLLAELLRRSTLAMAPPLDDLAYGCAAAEEFSARVRGLLGVSSPPLLPGDPRGCWNGELLRAGTALVLVCWNGEAARGGMPPLPRRVTLPKAGEMLGEQIRSDGAYGDGTALGAPEDVCEIGSLVVGCSRAAGESLRLCSPEASEERGECWTNSIELCPCVPASLVCSSGDRWMPLSLDATLLPPSLGSRACVEESSMSLSSAPDAAEVLDPAMEEVCDAEAVSNCDWKRLPSSRCCSTCRCCMARRLKFDPDSPEVRFDLATAGRKTGEEPEEL
jgi:hypothetical protein